MAQSRKRGKLAASTQNKYVNAYRKTLRMAVEEGVLAALPEIANVARDDNPRPFFRLEPLVPKELDEIEKLLTTADQQVKQGVTVRGLVSHELRDFIEFMLTSFLRPTLGEIFSLRHRQVISSKIRQGGCCCECPRARPVIAKSRHFRAVSSYERIRQRAPSAGPDDYLVPAGLCQSQKGKSQAAGPVQLSTRADRSQGRPRHHSIRSILFVIPQSAHAADSVRRAG